MSPDLEPLLADFRAGLKKLYGDRLVRLVLYGSQARGDVRARIGLDYEKAVSLLPLSDADFRRRSSAWLKNIRQEGLVL